MQDATLISGLLAKREQLRRDRVETGERMAILANDIEAVERILYLSGYTGDLPEAPPKPSRFIIFHRGELRGYILKELRASDRPLMPRELATRLCKTDGQEAQDQRLLTGVTKRISETLRKLKVVGVVASEKAPRGNVDLWRIASK